MSLATDELTLQVDYDKKKSPMHKAIRRVLPNSSATRNRLWLACGPLGILPWFIFLISVKMWPPIEPSLPAEEVVHHYRRHQVEIEASIYLVAVGSIVWPFYTIGANNIMGSIPGVNPHLLSLQVASGCTAGASMVTFAIFFATTIYRLDRDPIITQGYSDLALFFYTMSSAFWVPREIAKSIVCLSDSRPKPLIPRWVSVVNLVCLTACFPAYASHTAKHGPIAWNGGLTFATLMGAYLLQNLLETWHFFKAAGVIE